MLLSATPLTLGIAYASIALLSLNRGVQCSMFNVTSGILQGSDSGATSYDDISCVTNIVLSW